MLNALHIALYQSGIRFIVDLDRGSVFVWAPRGNCRLCGRSLEPATGHNYDPGA